MPRLSVAIISFNEEANLARTLEPLLPLAGEIVLVDSFSTDSTVEIAEKMGAKVYQEPWAGYVDQKNSCLDKCSGDWILSVDCDEVATPELVASIRKVLESDPPENGFSINRRTFYLGKLLRHSWQPDLKLRLFRRGKARWGGSDPHESVILQGRAGRLQGELIHYSYKDFEAHMRQTLKLARLMAAHNFRKGKKSGPAALLLKPPFALFKRLILKGGILDGAPGIMASLSTAFYMYLKNAYLWEMWRDEKNKGDKN